MEFREILLIFNCFALASILYKELNENYKDNIEIQKSSVGILSIALTQYFISAWLSINKNEKQMAEDIRYADWLFTTPLLLYTYYKLAENNGYVSNFKPLFVSVVAMIVLGYISEKSNNSVQWYVVSMIPYLYILYEITNIQKHFDQKQMKSHKDLGNFFIYGWAVYPLGFFLNSEYKYIIYNIGDFINKGVYSLELYKLLK